MISTDTSATVNFEAAPQSPTSLPPTPNEKTIQGNFLYPHFEQTPSKDLSPGLKPLVQCAFATVISPPHPRPIARLEFSQISVSSSPHTQTCSSYPIKSHPIHTQLYHQNHAGQTTDAAQQKYSTLSINYHELSENNEHFNSNDISTNFTCLNLHNELISDLFKLNSLNFETDVNNNSKFSDHNDTFFDQNTINKSSPCDNRQKVTRLPPFSELLSNHSAKPGVLESSRLIMRTQENLFDENDDADANSNSSYSSHAGEETCYTNLTNVGQSRLEEDQSCIDEASELNYLDWTCGNDYSFKSEPSDIYEHDDILCLGQNILFPNDEMNLDSPDSDGYSSSAERDSSDQCFSINNAADMPSHEFGSCMTTLYSSHDSSSSDEGYGEGAIPDYTLPDFAKLQNRVDPDKIPQRKRSSALYSKEKKKNVKESLHYVEKVRQKPGRKPGQVSNVLHLWEFMRDLLHNPECQGIIEWISKTDGVFRVMNSTEVARLWGEKKRNKKEMTYEKLSRSLRYSRLEGYFATLPKDKNYPKKLCFKFGPKSRNWC